MPFPNRSWQARLPAPVRYDDDGPVDRLVVAVLAVLIGLPIALLLLLGLLLVLADLTGLRALLGLADVVGWLLGPWFWAYRAWMDA